MPWSVAAISEFVVAWSNRNEASRTDSTRLKNSKKSSRHIRRILNEKVCAEIFWGDWQRAEWRIALAR